MGNLMILQALRSERLDLIPIDPRLADEMFVGLQAPEIYTYIADLPPANVEWLRERYARLASGKSPDAREAWLNWALRARTSEVLVGYVQATVCAERASIAYVLFPPAWGMGYASEAVAVLIDELKQNSITEIFATVDTRNGRSITLLERAHFALRSFKKDAEMIDSLSTDEYEYVYVVDGC